MNNRIALFLAISACVLLLLGTQILAPSAKAATPLPTCDLPVGATLTDVVWRPDGSVICEYFNGYGHAIHGRPARWYPRLPGHLQRKEHRQ